MKDAQAKQQAKREEKGKDAADAEASYMGRKSSPRSQVVRTDTQVDPKWYLLASSLTDRERPHWTQADDGSRRA